MGAFLFAQIMNIRFKFIDVLKIIIPSKASTFKYSITEKAREKSIKNKQTNNPRLPIQPIPTSTINKYISLKPCLYLQVPAILKKLSVNSKPTFLKYLN